MIIWPCGEKFGRKTPTPGNPAARNTRNIYEIETGESEDIAVSLIPDVTSPRKFSRTFGIVIALEHMQLLRLRLPFVAQLYLAAWRDQTQSH